MAPAIRSYARTCRNAPACAVVEIRRIPAQLGGQFSTQALVIVATGHLRLVLVVDHFDGADLNRLGQVVIEVEDAVSPGLWRQISELGVTGMPPPAVRFRLPPAPRATGSAVGRG